MPGEIAPPSLIIEVVEVRGKCPVHKIGDKIVIQRPGIDLGKDRQPVHTRQALFTLLCRRLKRGERIPGNWGCPPTREMPTSSASTPGHLILKAGRLFSGVAGSKQWIET